MGSLGVVSGDVVRGLATPGVVPAGSGVSGSWVGLGRYVTAYFKVYHLSGFICVL